MREDWFYNWIIVSLFLSMEIFFFLKIYLNWKNNIIKYEIFILIFYFVQNLLVILYFHFKYSKYFLFILLETMTKNIILNDPQDILSVILDTGLNFNYIVFSISLLFYLHLFFFIFLRQEEFLIYMFFFKMVFYFVFISLWIFLNDFITFHWEIFYQQNTFDFQADLKIWYNYYVSEIFDFLKGLFLLSSLFIINFLTNDLFFLQTLIKTILLRFSSFFFIVLFLLYFFGGESLLRDFWILILAFFCNETYIFSLFYLNIIKRYM